MTTGTVANPLAPGIVPVSSTSMNSTIFVDSKDTVKTVSSEDESSPSAEDEQNTIIHRPSYEHSTIDNNNESDEMAFLATEEERIMKQDEEKKEAEVFPDKCISSRNTNEADQTNGKTANNNLSLKRVKIVEPVKDSEEGAVPVKMEEDNIEKVTQLTGRSRIDSIDLDSHNFDFGDMGIDLGNNQDTTSQAAEDAPAPSSALENDKKTTSALPSIRKFSVSEETIEMALRDHHTPGDGSSAGRGRGFSIDFFAFGMNEDEPIPNNGSAAATATPHSSSNGGDEAGKVSTNRPRGDSIIFDPSSFGEGGIHEENALKGSHLMPLTSEVDEMEIMNAPGFSEAQPDMHTSTSHPISEIIIPHGARKRTTRVAPSPTMNPLSQQQSPYICDIPVSCSTTATTVDLNNKGSCAGAKTTTSNTAVPNNTHTSSTAANTTTTTTTSSSGMTLPIQFELLNKGGRIGMYLPHERKDRIAKFHSKRKLRIWRKRIKYDCRKKLADSRPRIKGRFVKRSDLEED